MVKTDIRFLSFIMGVFLLLALVEEIIINELGQGLTVAIAIALIIFGWAKNNM